MLWYIVLIILVYFIYKTLIKPLSYWKDRKIAYKKPWILVGNMMPVLLRKRSFFENVVTLYNDFPDERVFGIMQFTQPSLMIRDLELVKQIAIKDFDHFTDHMPMVDEEVDPIFGKNLMSLKGQRWKDMRSNLSPAFTSSKMKAMFHLMSDCAKQLTKYFIEMEEKVAEFEMKDVFTRYTNDIIASAAFGIKCDSLQDKDNEFYRMGKDITDITGLRMVKVMLTTTVPALIKFLRIRIFPEATEFFDKLVSETVKTREEQNIVRPDMINLLMEAKKGKLKYEEDTSALTDTGFATVEESYIGKQTKIRKPLTNSDIAAQALLFFFAGFDTASSTMSFMGHELAVNPDVQERLHQEIDDVLQESNGDATYEAIMKMKYLDMVVTETLRKWSPAPITDRVCVKDYVVEPKKAGESPLVIEKGMVLSIPIRAFHYDPKYFPNPDKFDPERFSDVNKASIVPFSFMPFGIGPRNCIGSRFALLEVKIMYFHLLSKFNLIPVAKTCIPMKITAKKFKMEPDNGFWVGFEKR